MHRAIAMSCIFGTILDKILMQRDVCPLILRLLFRFVSIVKWLEQGTVLSQILGYHVGGTYAGIFGYLDDVALLAPISLSGLN